MARVAFLGFGDYGAASLRGLLGAHDVVIAFTHPPRPDRPNAVAALARDSDVPLWVSQQLAQPGEIALLREAAPDFLVSTNWRRRVPDAALACARIAALNIHDSLLPKYAGLSAEQWVLRNGEARTGVTVHLMTPVMDVGGIVCQREVPIDAEDRAADVARNQIALYPEIIRQAIAACSLPRFEPTYVHPAEYERYHAVTEHDLRIDWSAGPVEILNMIRAHSDPYPNCFFVLRGTRFRLKAARRPECSYAGTPGRVVSLADDGMVVVTGHDRRQRGATRPRGLVLQSVQDEDGVTHSARDVLPSNTQLE
jgi:methionyl-tRNA formyltransferase